jgi:hypothetical protein
LSCCTEARALHAPLAPAERGVDALWRCSPLRTRVQLASLPSHAPTSLQRGRRMSNRARFQSHASVAPFQPSSTWRLFAAGSASPALAYIGSAGATSLSTPRPQLA